MQRLLEQVVRKQTRWLLRGGAEEGTVLLGECVFGRDDLAGVVGADFVAEAGLLARGEQFRVVPDGVHRPLLDFGGFGIHCLNFSPCGRLWAVAGGDAGIAC